MKRWVLVVMGCAVIKTPAVVQMLRLVSARDSEGRIVMFLSSVFALGMSSDCRATRENSYYRDASKDSVVMEMVGSVTHRGLISERQHDLTGRVSRYKREPNRSATSRR